MEDFSTEILVSAASVYEISQKVRQGKLPKAAEFESDLILNIENVLGFKILPLEPESMMRAARFEDKHGDPHGDIFDRMICAQAVQHHLPVLSTDPKLEAFGVRRLKSRSSR